MGRRILINPVFLLPDHAFPSGNRPYLPGMVEATVLRPIAERLEAVFHFARIPLINDHLYRHPAAPHAGGAFRFVGLRIEAAVAALSIYLQGRSYREERGRGQCLLSAFEDFQLRRFIELNRLFSLIGNGL